MNQKIKAAIKSIVPRSILDLLKKPVKYGFFGDYATWENAECDSDGYDSPVIFEKMKEAALKVKRGEASHERDGIAFSSFNSKESQSPIASALLNSAARRQNALEVLDFGGAFGNVYFQNAEQLKNLRKLRWVVVEQEKFAKYGDENFSNEQLSFFHSLDEALKSASPQLFLASSSIQYVKRPYELLKKVVERGFETIVFDKTPFWSKKDTLTVQKVPPRIYDASYPAWVLNESAFGKFFEENGYDIIASSEQGAMAYGGKSGTVSLKHFTLKKR